MDATFRASGLISNLDTSSIVETLVKLERRPADMIRSRRAAVDSQISALGDLSSKLESLRTAANALGARGVLVHEAQSTSTAFKAEAAPDAVAARYGVKVEQLAQAAKQRSAGFGSGALVTGGTLSIQVDGQNYDIALADGATLGDVAIAIRDSGAPVSAAVLDDGSSSYLAITAQQSGHAVGQPASSALSITETSTGGVGQPLGFTQVSAAQNARVEVDGLTFERRTNQVEGAVPGVTLSLERTQTVAEDLVVSVDSEGTQGALQKFVDAYNDVMRALQRQLSVTDQTNRERTLAGDSAVRAVQSNLQSLISAEVSGLVDVRTLADLGVKSARDGQLSLDATVLGKALARDPAAANRVFSEANVGMAARLDEYVKRQVESGTGALSIRKTALQDKQKRLDEEAERIDKRVDQYRQSLIAQFTAMEKVLAGIKQVGDYLTQQETQRSQSK